MAHTHSAHPSCSMSGNAQTWFCISDIVIVKNNDNDHSFTADGRIIDP